MGIQRIILCPCLQCQPHQAALPQEGAWNWGLLSKQLPGTVRKEVSRENEGQMSEKRMFPLQRHSRQPGIGEHNPELPENARTIHI